MVCVYIDCLRHPLKNSGFAEKICGWRFWILCGVGGSLCMMGLKILKLSPNFTVAAAPSTVSKTLPCVQDTLVDFNGCHGCMCYNHRLHTSLTGYCHCFTQWPSHVTHTHTEREGERKKCFNCSRSCFRLSWPPLRTKVSDCRADCCQLDPLLHQLV